MAKRKIFGKKSDLEDLSLPNKFICTSRLAFIYHLLELPISDEIHWSQIEPSHFIENKYFDKIGFWIRE